MLNGGNGISIDEIEVSNDIKTLLTARNSIELAITDANNIIMELDSFKGNTKKVLYEDATTLKADLDAVMKSIDENIEVLKGILADYRRRDEEIKKAIEANAAAAAAANEKVQNALSNAAKSSTSKSTFSKSKKSSSDSAAIKAAKKATAAIDSVFGRK